MAASMLSLGMGAPRAFWIAVASAALPAGAPPPSRAATVIARASLVNCAPRRASTIAFLCLIPAHFECPDMGRILRRQGYPPRMASRDRRSVDLQGLRHSRHLRRADRRQPRRAD